MKRQSALYSGKKGHYSIEFNDEDGSVLAKAFGPIPFRGLGWVTEVERATGKSEEDALRLIVDKLQTAGA